MKIEYCEYSFYDDVIYFGMGSDYLINLMKSELFI
jgi:hypothetical protein